MRQDVWELISANIRLDIVMEDIKAMIGACTIGKRRLGEVLARYGRESFDLHMDAVIESSERLARAEIERWPDGVYRGESWMVSDGIDPTARYRIAVEITVAGSEITFDFSETDDQAPGFTNMPPASALGAIRIAFLMLINAGGDRRAHESGPVRADPRRCSARARCLDLRSGRRPSSATRCATRWSRRSCSRSPSHSPTA